MHLGLTLLCPLCPTSVSREPCGLTKVPDGPQTYTLKVLWLQEKGAQMRMSEWGQSLTFTKDEGRGLLLYSHLHSGLSTSPSRWRCLLRVLCPVRRLITTLDWVLLKNINLALACRSGPEISVYTQTHTHTHARVHTHTHTYIHIHFTNP
jgi:hypothetical protein